MRWIIDGKWLNKFTHKTYRAKAFVITNGKQDPVKVFHDNYDFSNMVYLSGVVERDDAIKAVLLTPLTEEK